MSVPKWSFGRALERAQRATIIATVNLITRPLSAFICICCANWREKRFSLCEHYVRICDRAVYLSRRPPRGYVGSPRQGQRRQHQEQQQKQWHIPISDSRKCAWGLPILSRKNCPRVPFSAHAKIVFLLLEKWTDLPGTNWFPFATVGLKISISRERETPNMGQTTRLRTLRLGMKWTNGQRLYAHSHAFLLLCKFLSIWRLDQSGYIRPDNLYTWRPRPAAGRGRIIWA